MDVYMRKKVSLIAVGTGLRGPALYIVPRFHVSRLLFLRPAIRIKLQS